jgi:hypothetical protein
MANKRAEKGLGATDSTARPGRFPVGSARSRAAARCLLVARRQDERRVGFGSIVNGRVCLDGLAERIRAARLGIDADSLSTGLGNEEYSTWGQADSLAERLKSARERVARMPDRATFL